MVCIINQYFSQWLVSTEIGLAKWKGGLVNSGREKSTKSREYY